MFTQFPMEDENYVDEEFNYYAKWVGICLVSLFLCLIGFQIAAVILMVVGFIALGDK